MKISYMTVICNEEKLIETRLREIDPHVDEIVVIHDGTPADKSMEIARRFTDKAVCATYQGYCEPLRQVGLDWCAGDWVLVGDADELFKHAFLSKLYFLVEYASSHNLDGFMLKRLEFNLPNSPVTRHTRFFKRGEAYFSDIIHTNVMGLKHVQEVPGHLDYQLIHYSRTDGPSADPDLLLEKKRRYAMIQAKLKDKYKNDPQVLAQLTVDYGV